MEVSLCPCCALWVCAQPQSLALGPGPCLCPAGPSWETRSLGPAFTTPPLPWTQDLGLPTGWEAAAVDGSRDTLPTPHHTFPSLPLQSQLCALHATLIPTDAGDKNKPPSPSAKGRCCLPRGILVSIKENVHLSVSQIPVRVGDMVYFSVPKSFLYVCVCVCVCVCV